MPRATIRRLRNQTRHRKVLIQDRTRGGVACTRFLGDPGTTRRLPEEEQHRRGEQSAHRAVEDPEGAL